MSLPGNLPVQAEAILRLDVERMKASIMSMLTDSQLGLSDEIDRAVETALNTFDYQEHITRLVHSQLAATIKWAVDAALRKVADTSEFKNLVAEKIAAGLGVDRM